MIQCLDNCSGKSGVGNNNERYWSGDESGDGTLRAASRAPSSSHLAAGNRRYRLGAYGSLDMFVELWIRQTSGAAHLMGQLLNELGLLARPAKQL